MVLLPPCSLYGAATLRPSPLEPDRGLTLPRGWHAVGVLIGAHMERRNGKQCRERWVSHLDPHIKKGAWSQGEEETLRKARPCMHRLLVLGSWVGARRPIHHFLLLPATRMLFLHCVLHWSLRHPLPSFLLLFSYHD